MFSYVGNGLNLASAYETFGVLEILHTCSSHLSRHRGRGATTVQKLGGPVPKAPSLDAEGVDSETPKASRG